MARTALDLTKEEWRAYQPPDHPHEDQVAERWERAFKVARKAADLLRTRHGATQVIAFGSLAHRLSFTSWSDIDIAALDIPDSEFFRAVASVTGLSAEFKIDLVDIKTCRATLRQQIEKEGIEV